MDSEKYKRRVLTLIDSMAGSELDAVLIMSPAATCYFSGCYLITQSLIPERQAFVLVSNLGEVSYLVCNIEERMTRQESWIPDLYSYIEFVESPIKAVINLLGLNTLSESRIGVQGNMLSAEGIRQLKEAFPKNLYFPWDDRLERIMMIKDVGEIEAIQHAGVHTQRAIEAGLRTAAPASTEITVASDILRRMMAGGMTPMFNAFASGPNTLLVHAEPGDRVMVSGEIVRLDVGGRYPSHYLSDMARTAVVGEPSKIQAEDYQKLFNAQAETFEAIKPGLPVSRLFNVCKDTFEKQGLPFIMPHIGHGMGIGLHEAPMIHPGNDMLLETGMVLNIEPFLARPERGEGFHIEDLATVTQNGYRLLTEPARELIRIPE